MDTKTIRFSRKDSTQFFKTLNKRVNDYFKENKKQKNRRLAITSKDHYHVCPFPYTIFPNIDLGPSQLGQPAIDHFNGYWYGRCWYERDARWQPQFILLEKMDQ